MTEQKIKKMTIKDLLLNHKSCLVLIIFIIILSISTSLTSELKYSKEDNEIDNRNALNTEKHNLTDENRELSNNLKKQQNRNKTLNNKVKSEQGIDFQVKPGSKWTGIYTYSDDSYKMTLEINEHNAVFTYTDEDNYKYSYYMGKKVIESNTGYIELEATEMKDSSSGYMVNLSGIANGNKLNGLVLDEYNRKKGIFSLTKSN